MQGQCERKRQELSVSQRMQHEKWLTYGVNRWGCTPLQDAVIAGDEQLAHLLKRKGGTMSDSVGIRMLCDAASRGDVKMLNLLIKCAGLEVGTLRMCLNS